MKLRSLLANNYAFLLTGLLLLMLASPILRSLTNSTGNFHLRSVPTQGAFGIMMMIGVWSQHREKRLFLYGRLLVLLSLILSVFDWLYPSYSVEWLVIVLFLVFCGASAFLTAKHVFSGKRADPNMLFGAVCVYLLLGLIFSLIYGLIVEVRPDAFRGVELDSYGMASFDDMLYFSFVTLASLGYGDIIPLAPLARILVCIEVVFGQFYLAIMVAGLVALYLKERGT